MTAAPRALECGPRATYRLQLNGDFGFSDAAKVVAYLDELGISHCYCSPYLRSRSGSRHGYDVIDHNALDPEIGSTEAFGEFCAVLDAHDMAQIMDIVPNHMAVMGRDNPWWLDVLESGPASRFAGFFDIDWSPLRKSLVGKVLLPVLGDHYGTVLEGSDLELVIDRHRGMFAVEYHEHLFPVDPRDYPRILQVRIEDLRSRGYMAADSLASLEALTEAFANLPERSATDVKSIARRQREKKMHQQSLVRLIAGDRAVERYIEKCMGDFNRRPRDTACVDRMHELLEAQAYRLAYWRVASHEINYRRFFDVNDLACLRMENAEAFDATHRLILKLVGEGKVGGLRIDHPDGLFDPAAYFDRLANAVETARDPAVENERGPPVYIVAEKILGHGERLPEGWPLHGTTGYEFADLLNRLFVHPNGMPRLNVTYADFIGYDVPFEEAAYRAKKLIMQTSLASELNVLVAELDRIADMDPHTRDFGLGGLRNALLEFVACLPVYRCYISSERVSESDAEFVQRAAQAAKRRAEAADTSIFDFLSDVMTLRLGKGKDRAYRRRLLHFVMRMQQYTGPVAAKGVEDTAFYRHARLLSLNEVGCHPEAASVSIEAFHRENAERLGRAPLSMLATSTHDNKRSEDVRARIGVLTELASDWSDRVTRWSEINRVFKQRTESGDLRPDANLEYFLYQTLVGAWPLGSLTADSERRFAGRIQAYMQKAIKEAKSRTSWINPDAEYEQAVEKFVASVLDRQGNPEFFADFEPFQARVSTLGLFTSLSQTLLKLTVPGVPDIYQGNELWSFDLVDPDNRRPVDFGRRREMLVELESRSVNEALAAELLDDLEAGMAKLHVVRQALGLRRQWPRLFSAGEYIPLVVKGRLRVYLCAFARREAGRTVVVLAPRWFGDLAGEGMRYPVGERVWKDTRVSLPATTSGFKNLLTGAEFEAAANGAEQEVDVGRALAHFPVALLLAGDVPR